MVNLRRTFGTSVNGLGRADSPGSAQSPDPSCPPPNPNPNPPGQVPQQQSRCMVGPALGAWQLRAPAPILTLSPSPPDSETDARNPPSSLSKETAICIYSKCLSSSFWWQGGLWVRVMWTCWSPACPCSGSQTSFSGLQTPGPWHLLKLEPTLVLLGVQSTLWILSKFTACFPSKGTHQSLQTLGG